MKAKEIFIKHAQDSDNEQKGINVGLTRYRKNYPDFAKLFLELWRGSKVENPLPLKVKELIALAIVLTQHCKPCIFLHTKICLEVGASVDEIRDTAGIALAMGGGIVYEYIGYLEEAIELYFNKNNQ